MKKILVIDDTGLMLRNIKAMLEDRFTVKVAVSGAMGLTIAEKEQPDLILLDYKMPEMDGLETFDALRKLPSCKNTPIVFLTGADDPQAVDMIISKNPAGYLTKPVPKNLLDEMIDKLLG